MMPTAGEDLLLGEGAGRLRCNFQGKEDTPTNWCSNHTPSPRCPRASSVDGHSPPSILSLSATRWESG